MSDSEYTVGPLQPPPLPAALPEERAPALVPSARVLRPRPLLGPSLWVGGVLLWAYVVMGILTTTPLPFTAKRTPLDEGTAVLFVIAAFTTAGVIAVRRSLVVANGASAPRAGGIAASAVSLWILFVFGAMVLALLGFPEALVTFLLILWSLFAVLLGYRLTNRGLPRPDRDRVVTFGVWIGAVILSLMALLSRA